MTYNLRLYFLTILAIPLLVAAQRTADVHATYSYAVGENDNITLHEAKHKCIELAKAEAIKAEFGEMITSDVIDTNIETNGESAGSYFWENTVAMARGDWLGDSQQPKIDVKYENGRLTFLAEVWGKAREIVQAKADLKWKIMRDNSGVMDETAQFVSGERIFVKFLSASDGYLAIYLIVGDDETSCLLPYRRDPMGIFKVRNGNEYLLFDKETDPLATYYKLSTRYETEANQLVIIYSPNPFRKCTETSRDASRPNSLSTHDFQKWLLKCQRADRDMVVEKKWIKIRKANPMAD